MREGIAIGDIGGGRPLPRPHYGHPLSFWRGGKDSVSAKSACALCDSGCKMFDAFFLTYSVSPHNAAVCIATSCCNERELSDDLTALARDIGEARAVCAQTV